MLSIVPLQCILDMISTTKMQCTHSQLNCDADCSFKRIKMLYISQSRLRLISNFIVEFDREIVLNLSQVDTVIHVPPPDGYMYVSVTPLNQLRTSLKRCSYLLSKLSKKEKKDNIDKIWISCLQGIIAYESSWYKLFDILENSQPSLHRIVSVLMHVRTCLSDTNEYILNLIKQHTQLYYLSIVPTTYLPSDIQSEITDYLYSK